MLEHRQPEHAAQSVNRHGVWKVGGAPCPPRAWPLRPHASQKQQP